VTSRELVLAALRGETVPRPPVICPGGMMSFAVTEVMAATGFSWPAAHRDASLMAGLALNMQRATGVDNVGVPFCMTVEAEALGAEVNYGSAEVQPRVVREPLTDIGEVGKLERLAGTQGDRRPVVLEAIRLLRAQAPEVAVVGTVVGPVSLAGQVLEAGLLLRAMRRQPAQVHELLRRCAALVTEFALDQIAAGADAMMIAEPTGTGEILGGKLYREFADPYLRELIAALHGRSTPVILHICGNPRAILPALAETEVEAISVDETANLREARAALDRALLMGNIGADLLADGPPEAVVKNAARVLEGSES